MSNTLCDPYIYEDVRALPKILKTVFTQPIEASCKSELVNTMIVWYGMAMLASGALFSIYATSYPSILLLITATLILLPVFGAYVVPTVPSKTEAFTTFIEPVPPKPTAAVPSQTVPTPRNPFMNILLDEIKYNPTRPPASDIGEVDTKVALDDFFRVEFTSDPTDVFGRSQSQRQFITMPSTTIPNDQASFQDWLYKIPGKTCKEGGREACLPGTDGGKLPWVSADR
jgi:hypothetical protein